MPDTTRTSSAAAVVLVALTVLSPWPFGSTLLVLTRGIVLVAATAAIAGVVGAWRAGSFVAPAGVLWWLLAWLLGALQLVPLPAGVHHALAPGSAAVWHPAEPAAAAVLGYGMKPVSLYPDATLRWLAFSAAVVGLALVARLALHTRERLLLVASAVAGSGLLLTLYAFVARLFFGNLLYGWFEVPTVAPFGPFVSKNHFAGSVEMAACLAVGLAAGLTDEARRDSSWLSWLESRRSGAVIAAWGVAATLILAVPVSLSRGGVLSLAAGLTAFAAMRFASASHAAHRGVATERDGRRGRRLAVLLGFGLVTGAVVLAVVLPQEARARLGTLAAGTRTDTYRTAIWKDSLSLAASSPFLGSGFGAYADALPRFKTSAGELRVEHAENDYVELLCEGGVVGFGLIGIGVFILLREAWRRVQGEPRRLARAVRIGALAGVAALLVHSAFDFNLRIPSNALLAALLLACALAPIAASPRESRVSRGRSRSLNDDLSREPTLGVTFTPSVSDVVVTGRHRALAGRTAPVGFVGGVLLLAVSCGLAIWGPWHKPDVGEASLVRSTSTRATLRRAASERDILELVRSSPADAHGWAALAWLRLMDSPAEAHGLAAWAGGLDAQNEALRRATARLVRPRPGR